MLLNPGFQKDHQSKCQRLECGFTTIEVLVSVLIGVIFLAVAMQAIAVAAALRVRAQETGEAAIWVKNDLEIVSSQAKYLGGYNDSTGAYSNISNSACAATSAGSGYAAQLQNEADNHPLSSSADMSIGTSDTDQYFSEIGNREYTLQRITSIENNSPDVLQVSYRVYRGAGTSSSPIYRYYSEVIPGIAFACKQL